MTPLLSTAELVDLRSLAGAAMQHLCIIERPTPGAADDYGNASAPTYTTVASEQPCYLWSVTGREVLAPDNVVRFEDLRMMVPITTDVTEDDRIHGVTNEFGETVNPNVLAVTSVITRPTHKLLMLEQAA